MSRSCASCGEIKDSNEFSIDRQKKSGLSSYCRECYSAKNKLRYFKNSTTTRRNVSRNGISQSAPTEYAAIWRENNRESIRLSDEKYRINHPEKASIDSSRRNAALASCTIALPNAGYYVEMQGFYEFCAIFKGFEVDHIVPIRGKQACGLHAPWNLQVLPQQVNRKKSNLFNPRVFPEQERCAYLEI